MGKSWTNNLKKLDYTSAETLKRTIKRVFPSLNKEECERRFEIERQYIGWTKTKDEITGATVWNPPK